MDAQLFWAVVLCGVGICTRPWQGQCQCNRLAHPGLPQYWLTAPQAHMVWWALHMLPVLATDTAAHLVHLLASFGQELGFNITKKDIKSTSL